MNYIITKNKWFFDSIGEYNFCDLEELSSLPELLAFDTETTSLSPREGRVFSIQIGTGKDNYLIDLQLIGDTQYTFEDIIPFLRGKSLVGHNLTFDLGWCYKHDFYPDKTYDTFIASKILYNGRKDIFRHGFGHVMEREINVVYDKSEQKNIAKIQLSNWKTIEYAFNDVDRLLELFKVMVAKMREEGSFPSFLLHSDYIQALAYMEQCGLPTSKDAWKHKMSLDTEELYEKEALVINYIYDNIIKFRDNQLDLFSNKKSIKINLSSPKQMIEVFKFFNINHKDKDGKDSINEAVINKTPHEFIKIWLDFQSIKHDISTYGQNILDRIEDDTIFTSFNPILDTARISTRKEGINVLNFPANSKTRSCFIAHPGYKMIVADYEGQENAVGADMHKDDTMVKSLQDGLDLHCAFARLIFPEIAELDDATIMKHHKDKRNYSKAPRFLFSYGGNAFTLMTNNNIPLPESKKLEELYKKLHAGIYSWGDSVFAEAVKVGYIRSADGFRLHLPYYAEFLELKSWYDNLNEDFWLGYKKGKELSKKDSHSYLTEYQLECIETYKDNALKVSRFAKHKSQYYKLCLNNPVQSTAAHQTKRAAVMLFKYIKNNNHIGRARISNIPHDEFVLEVEDSLVEEYKEVLANCMIDAGNYYLKNNIVFMKAEANAGISWYEAK